MPMDREKYPDNWEAIALAIKDEADWQCECCGKQCRRPGEPFDTHKRTLTVMHLNHQEADCRPENLAASCAPCHLKYDATHHAANAAATRRRKRTAGQPPLPGMDHGVIGDPGPFDPMLSPGLVFAGEALTVECSAASCRGKIERGRGFDARVPPALIQDYEAGRLRPLCSECFNK